MMMIMTSPLLMRHALPDATVTPGVILPVPPHEILHIEAQSNYVRICTLQRRYFIRSSMADCVAAIPQGLGMRIHRSHWVAATVVMGIAHTGPRMALRLTVGKDVPVARRRKTETVEWVNTLLTSC